MVSKSERILCDGHRTAATSSAPTLIVNVPITFQSSGTVLEEVATPVPKVKGKDAFDGLTDSPVSKEHLVSRLRPTHSAPSAEQDNLVSEQIPSIPDMKEEAAICLFGEANQATKSSQDTTVILVSQTVAK